MNLKVSATVALLTELLLALHEIAAYEPGNRHVFSRNDGGVVLAHALVRVLAAERISFVGAGVYSNVYSKILRTWKVDLVALGFVMGVKILCSDFWNLELGAHKVWVLVNVNKSPVFFLLLDVEVDVGQEQIVFFRLALLFKPILPSQEIILSLPLSEVQLVKTTQADDLNRCQIVNLLFRPALGILLENLRPLGLFNLLVGLESSPFLLD